MRFFLGQMYDCSETPSQMWAVFAEHEGKTVVFFKSLLGKPTAERVCNKAKYDYARLHTTTDITADVMAYPEVQVKYGKRGQEVGFEYKEENK